MHPGRAAATATGERTVRGTIAIRTLRHQVAQWLIMKAQNRDGYRHR